MYDAPMTLSQDIRAFCSRHGLRINTSLGQHFLIDASVLDAIVEAANIQPEDRIVEIGAGLGILTAEILRKTTAVTAIEIDPRLIPLLRLYTATHAGGRQPTIVEGNALHIPLPNEPYKIVANIPYHITSPLLRHAFLESPHTPSSLTLLIQREVAEKICDARNAGLLTVIVGLFGNPRIVRPVPPAAFLPPPAVDSSVLHIDAFERPLADPATIKRVMRLAKHGFSQKRKMLRNTLGATEEGMRVLKQADIDPARRPQTLSVAEWITLASGTL